MPLTLKIYNRSMSAPPARADCSENVRKVSSRQIKFAVITNLEIQYEDQTDKSLAPTYVGAISSRCHLKWAEMNVWPCANAMGLWPSCEIRRVVDGPGTRQISRWGLVETASVSFCIRLMFSELLFAQHILHTRFSHLILHMHLHISDWDSCEHITCCTCILHMTGCTSERG